MSDVVLGVGFNQADLRTEARRAAGVIENELERNINPNINLRGGTAAGVGGGAAGGAGGLAGGLRGAAGRIGGAALLGGGLILGGLYGANAIVDTAAGIAQLGHQIRITEKSFEAFSGGSEQAAAKLEAVTRASGNTVDTMEAMRIANRAAALGMAETAGELERVTKFARTASAVLGGDVAGVLDNLALAASNLSYMRLDQMGISASRVRDRVKELTAANKDLSKEQAFLQAAIEVGEEAFASVTEELGNTTSGVDELRTAFNELRYELAKGPIGQGADSVFRWVADQLNAGTIQRQTEILEQQAEKYSNAWFQSGREVGAQLTRLVDLMERLDEMSAAGVTGVESMRERVLDLAYAIETGAVRGDEIEASVTRQIAAVDHLAYSWGSVQTAVGGVATQVGITEEKLKAMSDQIRGQIDAFNQTGSIYGTEVRQSPSYGGYDPSGTGSAADKQANLERESQQTREENARQAGIANAAKDEWAKAAQAMADEWERQMEAALRGVQGLFDTSGVTAEDLARSKDGTYEEKADEFVRRFADQVLNSVDRGINVEDVRQRVGLGEGATPEQILRELQRQWDSSELFAGGKNLDLINRAAVERDLGRAQRSAEGEQALAAAFGLELKNAGFSKEGMTEAVASGVVAGQQAYAAGGTPESAGGYVKGMADGMQTELQDEDVIDQLKGVGKSILAIVHSGWVGGSPDFDWITSISSAAKAQAEAAVADLAENPDVA